MKTKLVNAHHVNFSILKSNLSLDKRAEIDALQKQNEDVNVSENSDYVTITASYMEDVDTVESFLDSKNLQCEVEWI